MENVWVIIISSLVSGLLATFATILVNSKKDKIIEKRKILNTLLSYRYDITNQENVNAMNRIQAIFYEDASVLQTWKDFKETADDKTKNNQLIDKYLKLLERIAQASGYKKLAWDDIKMYYFPEGLSRKMIEEELIRSKTLEKITTSNFNEGSNSNNQTALMMIQEIMKQPNGVDNLIKMVEYSNKNKK